MIVFFFEVGDDTLAATCKFVSLRKGDEIQLSWVAIYTLRGFVVDENLSLANMIFVLEQFFLKVGVKKLRFKPAYNPYTEPSMEVCAHSYNGTHFLSLSLLLSLFAI